MDSLDELNKICAECMAKRQKNYQPINPKEECPFCPTGRKIHSLEKNGWEKVDWNSAKFAPYYRH